MYVVVKVVVAIIPPLELVWIRYVIAILALVIIGSIKRQPWRISKRHIPLIVTIGVNAIQRIKRKAGRYLEVEKAM
jgi:drug/metabolite transporter (DMT)-like permease